ncbi:MAG TPA: MDR family MFS transporter [Ktedonobacterales bacterium]|nr:MDR family MFS transporter [Ktedonobacterales bacterium]
MAESSMPSDQQTLAPQTGGGVSLRGWDLAGVLVALMLTMLLAALDQTIVSTALPKIIQDLNGFDRYTWVVTAYLLAETTVIPILGKLSDQFGRKWFLVAGVVIFLLGSMLSGTSTTMNQLIIYRGIQGIGAGFLFALIFTLIGDIFTPAERARWQGLFSGVFALASVIGPTLGGWISDTTTWRWVFYVNVPLGIVALLLLIFRLPANISARSTRFTGMAAVRRIDFAGAITASAATVCLLLGLTWGGQTYPWVSPQVIGTLGGGAALFVAFYLIERRAKEPILPLDLFRNRIFTAGAFLSLLVGVALFAVVIYLPLFIQGVLGQSATNSGVVITPLTLTMAIGSALVGQLIYKIGRYQFLSIIGAIIMTFGVFLMSQMNTTTGLGEVTRNMIVVGIGLGMLQPVLTLAVQNAIPRTRLGVGTSAVTYLRTMGQTLGTAIIGTIVNNTITTQLAINLPANAHRLPPALLSAATNERALTDPAYRTQVTHIATQAALKQAIAAIPPGPQHDQTVATLLQTVPQQVQNLLNGIFDATRLSLSVGIHNGFIAGVLACVLVVVATLFLKDVPLSRTFHQPPAKSGESQPEEVGEAVPAGH